MLIKWNFSHSAQQIVSQNIFLWETLFCSFFLDKIFLKLGDPVTLLGRKPNFCFLFIKLLRITTILTAKLIFKNSKIKMQIQKMAWHYWTRHSEKISYVSCQKVEVFLFLLNLWPKVCYVCALVMVVIVWYIYLHA